MSFGYVPFLCLLFSSRSARVVYFVDTSSVFVALLLFAVLLHLSARAVDVVLYLFLLFFLALRAVLLFFLMLLMFLHLFGAVLLFL